MYKVSGRWFGCGVNLNKFTLNDVNVWAGVTRYFGEKQRIITQVAQAHYESPEQHYPT